MGRLVKYVDSEMLKDMIRGMRLVDGDRPEEMVCRMVDQMGGMYMDADAWEVVGYEKDRG